MFLLVGGDSEIGAATYRYLKDRNYDVAATTRRRDAISPERPFFDILEPADDWKLSRHADAACIFVSVGRLRDCDADPERSTLVNVKQMLCLIDKLTAEGTYVLVLSSNQVFNGETPLVPADSPTSPVSEYGRQKALAEGGIRERIAKGAPIGILRLSKVWSDASLIRGWIEMLRKGTPIHAFEDMVAAPVPVDLASAAIGALLQDKAAGIYQLTGPRDVSYAEIGRRLADELGFSTELVKSVSAYSADMPEGSTPRHTTLDSSELRDRYGITVPDVWQVLRSMLRLANRDPRLQAPNPGAKVVGLSDLKEVAEGVYYSPYPLPVVDATIIEFLKHVARTCSLRRARFCAHLSPEAEQHDMLIVVHRDSYVTPHRHLTKSETFVVLEGSADMILFDEGGAVEKVVRMGMPTSRLPFFYRMPPKQFHSLAIQSELLVFLENTKGPFSLDDREHASWAPAFNDTARGKAFIASAVQEARAD